MTKLVHAAALVLTATAAFGQQLAAPGDVATQLLAHPTNAQATFLASNPGWQSLAAQSNALLFKDPASPKSAAVLGNVTYQNSTTGAWVPNDASISATINGWRIDGTAYAVFIRQSASAQHIVSQTYTDYATHHASGLNFTVPTLTYGKGLSFGFSKDGLAWNLIFSSQGFFQIRSIVSKRIGKATHSFPVTSSEALTVDSLGELIGNTHVGLTRAVMIPRFGKPIQCAAWSYSNGQASFTCDDTVLKDDQLPYIIDPQSQVTLTDSGTYNIDAWADGQGGSGSDDANVNISLSSLPSNTLIGSLTCSFNIVNDSLDGSDYEECSINTPPPYGPQSVSGYSVNTSATVQLDINYSNNSDPSYSDNATIDDVQLTVGYTSFSPSPGTYSSPPQVTISDYPNNNGYNGGFGFSASSSISFSGLYYCGSLCSTSGSSYSGYNLASATISLSGTTTITADKVELYYSCTQQGGCGSSYVSYGVASGTYTVSSPVISSLSPTSAGVGHSVTISGSNFGASQGSSKVTFNGTTAAPTSWNATSISVPVPSGATSGNVVVTVSGAASNGASFTVLPTPTISSLSPNPAAVSASITIAGTNFGSSQGSSTVVFNGTAATPSNWSATSIVVPVPTGAITGNVVVTVGGVPSAGTSFTIVPAPALNGLSPTSAGVGQSVTLSGSNFGSSLGSGTVTFNGTAATPTSWSATSIAVPVPTGATTGNVVVKASGVATGGLSFTVLPTPAISILSPGSAAVSASVIITGSNFGSTQGSSTVAFNGTSATPTSWSATSIVVPVPSGATTGSVVVTVSGVPSAGTSFTVLPTPSISILSPSMAAISASVTITGSNLGSSQGTGTVTFNGTNAAPTSWSATSIVVPVPSGATTGNVVVTGSGVATGGLSFTVLPTPSISILSPASAGVGQTVTITGSNLGSSQGTGTVTFNGTSATPTSWSVTSIVVPVPSSATTGNVVVTASGVTTTGLSFTVLPTPTITSLTPSSAAVTASITIAGTNFGSIQGSSTITFNGTSATPANWSATSIVAPVPTGATTGNVVVTVSNVPSAGASFTVLPTPSISLLSPASAGVGQTVTITGSNLGSSQGSGAVAFNGTAATPTNWSASSIVVPVPAGATTGNVVVTASGVATGGLSFTVLPTPTISSLSPSSGAVGQSVTIAGSNFGSAQGSSTVTFNGTAATPTSWSPTSIVVTVPSGATTGNLVVTVNNVPGSANFPVPPTPTITSLTPNAASVTAAVTIAGTNFGASPGSSTVTFNGTSATATSWSATSVTVTVPSGATTGNVVVTVSGVSSAGTSFTVLPPPTISGAPTSALNPGAQFSVSTSQAAAWTVSPSSAGSFNPTSSSANANVTFTVANPIPNSPLTATITATASGVPGTATINLLPPVTITPSGAISLAAGATQQYSANIPVNWTVTPSNGGTLSAASTTAGQQTTFTMGTSGSAIVTITATDQRYSTNQASTTVADPPIITPGSTPSTPLSPGGTLTVSANQSVTWSVNPASAGSFSASSSGANVNDTFTAANPIPNSVLSATITATGSGGSTASLIVNLLPPISITPSNPTGLASGSTAQFSANIPVNWTVPTTNGGSVSPTATSTGQATTFTMGTASGSVTLTATDQRYSSNSASVTIPPGTVAAVTSVSPTSGDDSAQVFTFKFSDTGGASTLTAVSALIGSGTSSMVSSCVVTYNATQNSLALLTDAGGQPSSTIAPGSGSAQNSQCILTGSGSTVSKSGNVLTLNLSLGFTVLYQGSHNVYGLAQDAIGSSGWQRLGSWSVPALPSVYSSMSPTTPLIYANSSPTAMTFMFFDQASYQDMQYIQVSFGNPNGANGSAASGANGPVSGCEVIYNQQTLTMYLVDDNGGWGDKSFIANQGNGAVLSNSQCSLSSASGNNTDVEDYSGSEPPTITMVLRMAFKSSYQGLQPVYAMAGNTAGQSSGWTQAGTVTVTSANSLTISNVAITSSQADPVVLTAGQTAVVQVTMNQPAPSGGISVPLTATNTAVLTVPSSVTIPYNSYTGSVTVTAQQPASGAVGVYVEATYGSVQDAPSPLILVEGATYPVTTLATSPVAGLTVTVDAVNQITPYNVTWPPGVTHTITANTQSGGTGIQYQFASWSPSGCTSAPSASLTCTAVFNTFYQLTPAVNPAGAGSITVNGSPLTTATFFISTSTLTMGAPANGAYQFSSYTCTSGCTVNGQTLTLTGPATVTANFTSTTTTTPVITSVTISPSPVISGGTATVTVALSGNPTIATQVTLSVTGPQPSLLPLPTTINIPTTSNQGSATFTAGTLTGSTPVTNTVNVALGSDAVAGTFTVASGDAALAGSLSKEYIRLGGRVIAIENAPAAPSMSPAPGAYSTAPQVTLAAASGTTIYYTTNGSTPSQSNGTQYSGPIQLSGTATINAIAYLSSTPGPIAAGTYTIGVAVLDPLINPLLGLPGPSRILIANAWECPLFIAVDASFPESSRNSTK